MAFTNYTIKEARTQLKNCKKMLKIYAGDIRFVSQQNGWLISIGYLRAAIATLEAERKAVKIP